MLVQTNLKDGNSPQHKASCSPARCVSVDGKQCSWCPWQVLVYRRYVSSPLQVWAWWEWYAKLLLGSVSYPLWEQEVMMTFTLSCLLTPSINVSFFYFFPKRPLILEGKKFSNSTFRASLYCFSKAKLFKLLLHIFICIFGTCKRTSYFLS